MGWYFKTAFQADRNALRKLSATKTAAPNAPIDNTADNQWRNSNATDVQPPHMNNEVQIAASTLKYVDRTLLDAGLGNRYSQVAAGDMYMKGKGVPQDYQAAMDWYLKATEQGDPAGQRNVGRLHYYGHGVPRDYSAAMSWTLKAANQGYSPAQRNVGLLNKLGQGVPQDDERAMFWHLKAANQGLAISQETIGDFYSNGLGVPRDYTKAAEWYRRAADQGHAYAETSLAYMRKKGQFLVRTRSNMCV
ncbi:hypothetical protein KI688_005528 [Linnemannia hyalina]|uniref:HCP-like protein n=1 Tax=Linnemannia hyalina TaxID=64524 RepID=A0A9P7Y392_9FUNG|nr:hypothetical protein KI688_005528 [Linnemannia hyalina]